MYDALRQIVMNMFRGFAKPDITIKSSDGGIERVDKHIEDIERKQREVAARIKLLEIQSNPRGYPRG